MVKVAVNPEVLRWASERSSRDAAQLKQRFPTLSRWIAGEARPTLGQLEDFSKATATPLGFLFLDSPPTDRLPIPNYRTKDDQSVRAPSAELLDTIYIMQRRQAWLRDYLIENGVERAALVRSARPDEAPPTVAAQLRENLRLSVGWSSQENTWTEALRTLRGAMGHAGVVVAINGVVGNDTHRPLDVDEFRGFVLTDDYAPLVFVNAADAKSAQMFTLAHELAHLAFGISAVFDLSSMQPAKNSDEQACNRVAAEFLVPAVLLQAMWKPQLANPYEAVARAFKVSRIVAARRLLDLALITREEFFNYYRACMRTEKQRRQRDESGGNFYATASQRIGWRLATEIGKAFREKRIFPTEAYRLTGLTGKTFDEFFRRVPDG